MALATTTDVETVLGRSLSAEEEAKANLLLAQVSEAVTNEAGGYRFAPGTYTIARKVGRGRVRIPAVVDSVEEVRSLDSETGLTEVLTGWTLRRSTLYAVDACEVEIDFTVTEAVPPAIISIVALACVGSMTTQQGVTQAVAGVYSMSYVDSAGRVWLSGTDKAIARRYRLPAKAVALL